MGYNIDMERFTTAIIGGGAHTRGEWVDLSCLENAIRIALGILKWNFE